MFSITNNSRQDAHRASCFFYPARSSSRAAVVVNGAICGVHIKLFKLYTLWGGAHCTTLFLCLLASKRCTVQPVAWDINNSKVHIRR